MNSPAQVEIDPTTGYFQNIETIRSTEYPSIGTSSYLDHAATTPYPKSLIEAFSRDLTSNLFGNPHSASASSQLSTQRIDDVRLEVLRFVNADPDLFDVVFTANATAAVKLVAEAFRDHPEGFDYGYHVDSHTSLVGVREVARQATCLANENSVTEWVAQCLVDGQRPVLLAYPGQSNMTGRRYDYEWCEQVNEVRSTGKDCYTLFDAAALASTAPLDLSDTRYAPSFTVLSFYKIFGFPDLGALIVRKDAADVFSKRRYFGGGTVDVVSVSGKPWHASKDAAVHARLEDGTLPFHSIIALQHALRIHRTLYGSMANVSRHCRYLAAVLRQQLLNLRHASDMPVCRLYESEVQADLDPGPIVAFNLVDSIGRFVSNAEVEKIAVIQDIHIRTGGLCNPGGTARALDLTTDELRQNYEAGFRCGGPDDLINGKPTGTIRVSFGAMSSLKDVENFVTFLRNYFVDASPVLLNRLSALPIVKSPKFVVENLTIFPIKSCAAYNIPSHTTWQVTPRGLALDREWCLVHLGTHQALSQKRHPHMALLRPKIDLHSRSMSIRHNIQGSGWQVLHISLDTDGETMAGSMSVCSKAITSRKSTSVCGESVDIEHYTSTEVIDFFSKALDVPCTLARFPRTGIARKPQIRGRADAIQRPIALANESPILLVSRSSVNRLNEDIKARGSVGKTVPAESFRGNIVISEELQRGQKESPYAEDDWKEVSIINEGGTSVFEVLGPCQRCQMVCIDQGDASRQQEPFSTLARTRRHGGKVWFGLHLALGHSVHSSASQGLIRVGDYVSCIRT